LFADQHLKRVCTLTWKQSCDSNGARLREWGIDIAGDLNLSDIFFSLSDVAEDGEAE